MKLMRSPRALLVLGILGAGGVLAACGSSSSSKSSTAQAPSNRQPNRAALVACMRQHGINLPSGGGPGGGAPGSAPPAGGSGTPPQGAAPAGGLPSGGSPNPKLQAALKACGATIPAGRRPAAASKQAIQKYTACVRDHGYKLPKPNLSGSGPVFPSSVRSNAKFQTASRACQNVLAPGGGSGQRGA
jgi:hypothetical protein